jgi:tripartite-type tricarboxylate transporter receptor subunit TctC
MMRAAAAETYPGHPIAMVVPFAAGGGTDIFARIFAEGMRSPIGQPVIVENVAGAGGSIGVSRVVHAPPDGYTLSIGTLTTHVLSGALYPLQFDLLTDLAPIAELGYEPLLIAAKNSLPVSNLKELIAWLKANPDSDGRHSWHRFDRKSCRTFVSKNDRDKLSVRAVSRGRARSAGSRCRPDRSDD